MCSRSRVVHDVHLDGTALLTSDVHMDEGWQGCGSKKKRPRQWPWKCCGSQIRQLEDVCCTPTDQLTMSGSVLHPLVVARAYLYFSLPLSLTLSHIYIDLHARTHTSQRDAVAIQELGGHGDGQQDLLHRVCTQAHQGNTGPLSCLQKYTGGASNIQARQGDGNASTRWHKYTHDGGCNLRRPTTITTTQAA